MKRIMLFFLIMVSMLGLSAAEPVRDIDALRKAPAVTPVTEFKFDFEVPDNIRPVWLESVPFHGKPVRVFAWFGMPRNTGNKPVPGMVLVHGGGGTAFAGWVKYWTDRGVAAIAVDCTGSRPVVFDEQKAPRVRHDFGGAPDNYFVFEKDLADQWSAQAVTAVILANSFLRSQVGVDPDRIGITGISWGGYLTCLAASLDDRFAFAAPVYGCGFLEDTWFATPLGKMKEADRARWLAAFDPAKHLGKLKMPVLFINGPNDRFYLLGAWQRSSELPQGKVFRSLPFPFGHSHQTGRRDEVAVFADAVFNGKALPPEIKLTIKDGVARADYVPRDGIVRAELVYTADAGTAAERKFQTVPAKLANGVAEVRLPADCRAGFVNIYDQSNHVWSSPVFRLEPK
ncbi:MAG: alpha/beta hydrolase family protein [Victivallaceae bacterium]